MAPGIGHPHQKNETIMNGDLYWNGWDPILRIIVVGFITYAGIIAILRVSGKRTLASMYAFDFIVTVAIGSAFGRILTAGDISISEAFTAFILLVLLQFIVSFLEIRSQIFHRIITSQPRLLYYNGNFLEKNLKKERLLQSDIRGAVRKKNFSSMDEVEAVVLETDGQFSVIRKNNSWSNTSYNQLLPDKNI